MNASHISFAFNTYNIFHFIFSRITAEKCCDDLRNKLDRVNDQNASLEGELANLRNRIDSLEDENARLKKDKKTLQDDIVRIRAVSCFQYYLSPL